MGDYCAIPACSRQFYQIPNSAIQDHNTETYNSLTLNQCQILCVAKSWCNSLDFNKFNGQCFLSNETAFSVGGLKYDYDGNPWDHYGKFIPPVTPYSVPQAAISGYNDQQYTAIALGDCLALCSASAWCKSVDYSSSSQPTLCYLSSKTASSAGGLKHDYDGNIWDHYGVRV